MSVKMSLLMAACDSSGHVFKYFFSDATLVDDLYTEYKRRDSLSIRDAYINLKVG